MTKHLIMCFLWAYYMCAVKWVDDMVESGVLLNPDKGAVQWHVQICMCTNPHYSILNSAQSLRSGVCDSLISGKNMYKCLGIYILSG